MTQAALAARLRRLSEELMALVEDLEREPAPARPAAIQQKKRRTGPVPVEIRKQRQQAWGRRYLFALELGLNPSKTFFAAMYRLGHPSVLSRWLTGRSRCIRPGSALDERIWCAMNADNVKLEGLCATRHGAAQIAKPAPQISVTMTA